MLPLPVLPAAFTACEDVPVPGGHHWADGLLLRVAGAQWDQSSTAHQMLFKAGWTDSRNPKPG